LFPAYSIVNNMYTLISQGKIISRFQFHTTVAQLNWGLLFAHNSIME